MDKTNGKIKFIKVSLPECDALSINQKTLTLKAIKIKNTTHPSQEAGAPQPQPYVLALNHIFFVFGI